MLNIFGNILLVVFLLALVALYVRNIFKLISNIKTETYTFITLLRVFGIYFFLLGIVMGCV